MKTLADAWEWYVDVKKSLARMVRIGDTYWDRIRWDEPPWRGDRHFIELTREEVVKAASHATLHLDDLAVVVLFSVFEANVRATILEEVKAEETEYRHRAVADAIETAKEKISEGSFFAVLKSFKGSDNNLIEQVNQVRKYRNWVSHGRRGAQPAIVTPPVAHDRLTRCLGLLFPAVPDEWIRVSAYHVWEAETRPGARDAVRWTKAKVHLQELVRTRQLKL